MTSVQLPFEPFGRNGYFLRNTIHLGPYFENDANMSAMGALIDNWQEHQPNFDPVIVKEGLDEWSTRRAKPQPANTRDLDSYLGRLKVSPLLPSIDAGLTSLRTLDIVGDAFDRLRTLARRPSRSFSAEVAVHTLCRRHG